MSKEKLLISAKKLTQPEVSAAEEYSLKRDTMVEKLNKIMLGRADLENLIGQNNIDMMLDNHRNHARFIESILFNYEPEILVTTVLWVYRAYRTHGFKLTYWPAQLNMWIKILKEELSELSYNQIYPFYNWMLINQVEFVEASDDKINLKNISEHK